jgi:hypothetical protein
MKLRRIELKFTNTLVQNNGICSKYKHSQRVDLRVYNLFRIILQLRILEMQRAIDLSQTGRTFDSIYNERIHDIKTNELKICSTCTRNRTPVQTLKGTLQIFHTTDKGYCVFTVGKSIIWMTFSDSKNPIYDVIINFSEPVRQPHLGKQLFAFWIGRPISHTPAMPIHRQTHYTSTAVLAFRDMHTTTLVSIILSLTRIVM